MTTPLTRRAALATGAALAGTAALGLGAAGPAFGAGASTSLSVGSTPYGTTAAGTPVERWTFGNDALRVSMITYGATITSIETPDRHGTRADVALGQSTLAEYEALTTYFGATIGRYANRIAGGHFTLDGVGYQVPVNDPDPPVNALHGGPQGFDTKVWSATAVRARHRVGVRFSLVSPDGDMGFPGRLAVDVEHTVSDAGELGIAYTATTDAPTVVNLTNHVYLNLAGESSGDVYGHRMQIRASRFTPIDAVSIPLGPHADVAGTPFDFRSPHTLGERIRTADEQILRALGYDHNWVFDDGVDRATTPVVTVVEPTTGRVLQTFTDQPGVQLYTGNSLTGSLVGPGGTTYRQGAGFTLETQHFPDSPHEPSYPTTVLRPGQTFTSRTTYRFCTV